MSERGDLHSASCAYADLRDIVIDESKSVPDRVKSFLEQVRDPYIFKVGDILVKVRYTGDAGLTESLITLMTE